jgi:hypothetical protein
MPSESRIQWDRLIQKCEESDLPKPVMSPMGFDDKVSVCIRHQGVFGFSASAPTMLGAIDKALLYVWGYRNALRDAAAAKPLVEHRVAEVPERNTPKGMRHQAWLACCEVLQDACSTPIDKKLARAVLATNTAASLEKYNENQQNSS